MFWFFLALLLVIIISCVCTGNKEESRAEYIKYQEEKEAQREAQRQELEKLPHIENDCFVSWLDGWFGKYTHYHLDFTGKLSNLSADAVKYFLQKLLGISSNISLVVVSSEFGLYYETLCELFNFLAKKDLLTIKKYKFPAVYDKLGLLVKQSSEYLVINVTVLGKEYAKEEEN